MAGIGCPDTEDLSLDFARQTHYGSGLVVQHQSIGDISFMKRPCVRRFAAFCG